MKNIFKLKIHIFLFLFLTAEIFAQNYNIDYYGIVATNIDSNMAKMTSDLYFTQLSEIQNFTVNDKRTAQISLTIDKTQFSEQNLSFFSELQKDPTDEKWNVTFHIVDNKSKNEQTETKIYDSFYKILMEPKATLQESLKNLVEKQNKIADKPNIPVKNTKITSTENLSGTWKGENFIDKIVILRGGRGFVIFNNGASMNISLEIKNSQGEQKVLITQKGHSNASYFPDLPRKVALNAALSAEPITWDFSIIDNNTLKGIKNTLVADSDNYKTEKINVTWNRVNEN